jgi:hypothetical protein
MLNQPSPTAISRQGMVDYPQDAQQHSSSQETQNVVVMDQADFEYHSHEEQ